MKKGFAEPFSCSAIRERPTRFKGEGIQLFDVGKQVNESPFWVVACTCTDSSTGDHTVHHPKGPDISLEPGSSDNIISQPVPVQDAERPKQGRQVCQTTTSTPCQKVYLFPSCSVQKNSSTCCAGQIHLT